MYVPNYLPTDSDKTVGRHLTWELLRETCACPWGKMQLAMTGDDELSQRQICMYQLYSLTMKYERRVGLFRFL